MVRLYVGGALKDQHIPFDYASPHEDEGVPEDFFVRDFDLTDSVWSEGYEVGFVDEGPFTKEAAEALAKLLNERNKDKGLEYRAVLDKEAAKRRSEA